MLTGRAAAQDAATATEQRNARSRKQKLLVHLVQVLPDAEQALERLVLLSGQAQRLEPAAEPEPLAVQPVPQAQAPQMQRAPGPGQQEALPPASDPAG